eukprot:maker-scaffold_15-snap-gene-10.78-mRNA-1 protein AED:0.06 eAED:0.06 QI:0/0/0/1/0/0/2/0/991
MKSVEQVFAEPSPATLNYRTTNNRRETLQKLMDADQNTGVEPVLARYSRKNANTGDKLTWKNGVFIPVLLNIWGVIMFLRLGWVVGQAGLLLGTLIIIAANVVTGLTSLSLCAICTNGEVEGGGVYFLISRALGPVYGGTIGVLFFCAQAIATSLYVIGFAESVVDLIVSTGGDYFTGSEINDIRVIGLSVSVVLLLVALVGIGWYAKTQVGLLIVLLIAMASVFVGAFLPQIPNEQDNEEAGFVGFGDVRNLGPNFQDGESFFTVFAVFFPAVTGIMAGANLSGDLDNPSVAIPKGTLSAIALTFVSYLLLLWFVGLVCLAEVDGNDEGGLLYNTLIMKDVSVFEYLVYIGVFAATLSSALASLVGAPRILQSVASDKLFPWPWFNFFSYGTEKNNEPIRAYFLTFAINCGCVAVGDLNAIAPIITNFFMISYALTNYACFASSHVQAPNWRPSFRYYNKYLSAAGALLCIIVMFLIDWIPALITCVVAVLMMMYLNTLDVDINWGEAGQAMKYTKTLESLETLQMSEKVHVKTFRPQFLLMTGDPYQRLWLLKFTSLLSLTGGGILIAGEVIDKSKKKPMVESAKTEENGGGDLIKQEGELEGDGYKLDPVGTGSVRNLFNKGRTPSEISDGLESVVADSIYSGFHKLMQLSGVGRLRPNTVVLGFKTLNKSTTMEEIAEFEKIIRTALSAQVGLLVVRDDNRVFDINMKNAAPTGFFSAGFKLGNTKLKVDETSSVTTNEMLDKEVFAKDFESQLGQNPAANETADMSTRNEPSLSQIENTPKLIERVKRYKKNDVEFVKEFEAALPSTLPGTSNNIDVWWLADDGGLTMLLPQLLVQNPLFKDKSLRVVAVTNKFQNAEETSRLKKTELRMIHLLNKFRIRATTVGVDLKLEETLQPNTVNKFKEVMGIDIEDLDIQERNKTTYYLRIAEEMKRVSRKSSMVFVILPIPETALRVKLYTAWLDMLSYNMPPMVMMRGNNQNVLTFFC